MTVIRIGVVGLGKIARDQHVPAIEANPSFELVATVERSAPGSAINFPSHEAMLASGVALDAVAITTPPGPRYAIARDCIAAGLHVLLEKPPTASLAEIGDLSDQASAAGVTLFTTWHARHNPAVSVAAELLRGRHVRGMTITWHEDAEKWHPGQRWIWAAGGFGVFDPGINAFSIASRIFPGPLIVDQAALYFRDGSDTPVAADIRFASSSPGGSLRCSLDWRHTSVEEWSIVVVTEDEMEVRLLDGGSRLQIDGIEQTVAGDGEYPDIYRRFFELVSSRQSEVDPVPLRLVADCLLVGSRHMLDNG